MRQFPAIFISLFLAFSCLAETLTGKVVSVYDGDTITVLDGTTQVKIRLQGIDTPESKQPFGSRAKQALSKMIFGKTVKVEWEEKDRYGRTIGDIFEGDTWVNLEMVKQGMAWHYKQYSKDKRLEDAEKLAKIKNVGLWVDSHALAPWDWRKGVRPLRVFDPDKPEESKESATDYVYITATGTKYHGAGCRYLKASKRKVTLQDALGKAMEACKVCVKK